MVATLLWTPAVSLSAEAFAKLEYVPALELGGASVGACTCTVAEAPGARFPKPQSNSNACGERDREMLHVPGPPYGGLMLHGKLPEPGRKSVSRALNAVPVPAALLLLTVIV